MLKASNKELFFFDWDANQDKMYHIHPMMSIAFERIMLCDIDFSEVIVHSKQRSISCMNYSKKQLTHTRYSIYILRYVRASHLAIVATLIFQLLLHLR
jgi:hypothetical protein